MKPEPEEGRSLRNWGPALSKDQACPGPGPVLPLWVPEFQGMASAATSQCFSSTAYFLTSQCVCFSGATRSRPSMQSPAGGSQSWMGTALQSQCSGIGVWLNAQCCLRLAPGWTHASSLRPTLWCWILHPCTNTQPELKEGRLLHRDVTCSECYPQRPTLFTGLDKA